ncbi:MAG: hypothetical protein U9R15_00590 [Chloroflexota bacterium]|nr:hypothetical protein [Chloroflexota bacterium]
MAADFPVGAGVAIDECVGVEWNQGTDTWRLIDEMANTIVSTLGALISTSYFNNHPVWGNIRRCTLADDGSVNHYGSNARGDGLTLDGTDGQVMVEIPKFYVKSSSPSANVYRRWISPVAKTGFEVHPWFKQRGGTERDHAYFGAYEAYKPAGALESRTGVAPAVSTAIATFRTNAQSRNAGLGQRWGITSIWGLSAIQTLFYIEYAGADSQSLIGRGRVDAGSKLNTGADSADTNIGTNGTGTGTGADGQTPIAYRGIENLWGNIYKFVDGYDAVDGAGGYHLINRDGSGTFANPMAGGDYESSVAAPTTTDGYIKNIVYEDLLKYLMISDGTAGSASTYLCDYFYAHNAGETNILLSGGHWTISGKAGVAFLSSTNVATPVHTSVGARLEFV